MHLVAAALTVPVNCKIGSTNFQPMTQFVVGMKLAPGLSEYAATGAQAVLEARKVCPHITDATADRGYTPYREAFTRELHKHDINTFTDYKRDVIATPRPSAKIGKRKHSVTVHAGTFLSAKTPEHLWVLPDALKGTDEVAAALEVSRHAAACANRGIKAPRSGAKRVLMSNSRTQPPPIRGEPLEAPPRVGLTSRFRHPLEALVQSDSRRSPMGIYVGT